MATINRSGGSFRPGVSLDIPPRVWRMLDGIRGIKGKTKEIMRQHAPLIEGRAKELAPHRSGRFSRAITVRFEVQGNIYVLYVTAKKTGNFPTPAEYFLQRELGGTIRMKSKLLTIPHPDFTHLIHRGARNITLNPQQLGFTRVFARKGSLLGVTRNNDIETIAYLRRSVTQKGAFFATRAIKEHRGKISNALRKMIKDIRTGAISG